MTRMRTGLPMYCLQGLLLTGPACAASTELPPLTAENPAAPVSKIPQDDLLFASPTRLDHIGRIVVGVFIDGEGPFRFIVDTGANYSTISPGLAGRLGLTPAADSAIIVNGITGTQQAPSVPILRLQAGDLVIENQRLPVVWAPLMAGADGILGVAGLTNERLVVDFQHNRVSIARSRHAVYPRDSVRIPAKRIRGGLMSVLAQVGGVRVQAIIDTGSERTIANTALRDALYRRSAQQKLKNTNVYGATTDIASGQMVASPIIDLGSARIGSVTLVFGSFHIFDVWGLTQRPAMIVGMDILGTLSGLSVDFRQAEILLDSRYHFDSAAFPLGG
jgi:predicted aspartyl protease